MPKQIKQFLTKIYTYVFFDDFILIYPLYAVMFADFGLETHEIAILFIIWSVTAFIFEVPSGVLADKFSRKTILIIGQLFKAVAFLLWLVYPSFSGFALGFILWGIGGALASGTFESYIFDRLKEYKQEKEYTKIIGRMESLRRKSILIATFIAAAPFAIAGYNLVILLSILSVFLSIAPLTIIEESTQAKSTEEKEYFSLLKLGLKNTAKNPNLFKIVVFASIGFGLYGTLEEFWPIIVSLNKLPTEYVAIAVGIIGIFEVIGSSIAFRFKNRTNIFFTTVIGYTGVALATTMIFQHPLALLILIPVITLVQSANIVFDGKMQALIPSKTRATVTSVASFISEVVGVILFITIGIFSRIFNDQIGFIILGIIIIVIGIIYTNNAQLLPQKISNKKYVQPKT